MVDWKKDIKLSGLLARDKQDGAPEEAEAFGLESEAQSVAVDETATDRGDAEETPFWKRELKFGRRMEADESTDDFEAAPEDAEKRSFFRRELSFGRPHDDAVEETSDAVEHEQAEERPEPVAAAADEAEPAEHTPFWKRELSFGRPRDDAVEETSHAVEHEQAEERPEPVAAAADEAEPAEHTPFWKRELSFGRSKDPDVDASEDESDRTPFWKRELTFGRQKDAAESLDAVEPPAEDAEKGSPFSRELSFGRRRGDAVEETAVEAMEPAQEQTDAFAADPTVPEIGDAVRAQAFDDVVEASTPVDAVEPAREQPEPVAAARPEAEPAEDTPFWKRELSFGSAEDPDFDAPDTDKRSFFKRDFSFRRAKEDNAFVAPKDDEEKRPFFKRDFRFRRARDRDLDVHEEAPEGTPFWKRELSFPGARSGHQVTTDRAAKGGRKKQLVGLKVGASQIAAARIVNNGSPELVQLARQPIEQGIVVGGELRDPDALAEALREFFARNKLPSRNVRLGIGNNRIGVRTLEISGVHDPKQLENAIRFRAQEALPIPLDEAVLDYHVIDETVSPTGIRTYEVMLVVAYRELIDRFVAACEGAGVRLVGIDLEAFALLRALAPPPSESFPEDTALVAVSIGHDRSTFAVSNGTVCEFTRVLDWGGSSLNTAIARALDITPSQAEPVKRTLSLGEGDQGAAASNNEHTARAEEAVRLELQSFARELVSSLHFYQNQTGSLAIGTIILTGGTAHMPGLAAELQRLIGVKVRVGDPLRRLKTARRVEQPEQVGSMAVAIGLGIED